MSSNVVYKRALDEGGGRDVWRMGGECGDVDGGVVMGRRM